MIAAFGLLVCGAFAQTNSFVAIESLEQRAERMGWYRNARFGMFIHWGPYAGLGGEYQGRNVGWIAEWIQHTARIPAKEYESAAAAFNPVKFDACEWVKIAKDAGMKYIANITTDFACGIVTLRTTASRSGRHANVASSRNSPRNVRSRGSSLASIIPWRVP